MRKARDSPGFRFTATPVAPTKAKKITAAAKESSPVRKPNSAVKDKTVKIKLQPPKANKQSPASSSAAAGKVGRGAAKKVASPRKSNKEEPPPKLPAKRRRRSAAGDADGEEEVTGNVEYPVEEVTVKDKWMKLYRDKYRAADEARFRAIQVRIQRLIKGQLPFC